MRPCQVSSPRQKLVIKLDQKTQRPCGVKIGCCHQSWNGFPVQPNSMTFSVEPVASPKWIFVQTTQIPIGIAAKKNTAARATTPARGVRRRISSSFAKTTTSATAISGTVDNFVRYAAAPAKPVTAPSHTEPVCARSHCSEQRNSRPKQSGDRMSLLIA